MKSTAMTRGVRVQVESEYLPARSHPQRAHWFFTYHVRIDNLGDDTVQLLSRHWIIENGHGKIEHVRGPGVVGETPVLAPGQSFGYQSYCPLDTPVGTMRGSYQMIVIGKPGEGFDVAIAPFTLACPSDLN